MLRLSSKLKIMRPKMSQIFQNYGVASMQYKTPSGDPLFSGTTLVVATFNNYNDTQNKAAKVGLAALMIVVALVNIPLSILEGVARLLLSLVSPNFTLKQGSETFKNVLKSGLAVAEGVKLIGQAFSAPQIHPALHQVPSNGYQYPQRPEAPDNNADGQNPSNGGPDNQTPLNNAVAEGVKLIGQAFSAPQIHPALPQVPSNGYQDPQGPEAPDNNPDGQNPSNGGP